MEFNSIGYCSKLGCSCIRSQSAALILPAMHPQLQAQHVAQMALNAELALQATRMMLEESVADIKTMRAVQQRLERTVADIQRKLAEAKARDEEGSSAAAAAAIAAQAEAAALSEGEVSDLETTMDFTGSGAWDQWVKVLRSGIHGQLFWCAARIAASSPAHVCLGASKKHHSAC